MYRKNRITREQKRAGKKKEWLLQQDSMPGKAFVPGYYLVPIT